HGAPVLQGRLQCERGRELRTGGAGTKASRSGPQLIAGCPDGRARRSDGRLHTGGWFPLRAAHHSTHRCCVRRAGRAMPSSLKPLHPGGCFSLGTLGCPVIGTMVVGRGREDLGKKKARATRCEATGTNGAQARSVTAGASRTRAGGCSGPSPSSTPAAT